MGRRSSPADTAPVRAGCAQPPVRDELARQSMVAFSYRRVPTIALRIPRVAARSAATAIASVSHPAYRCRSPVCRPCATAPSSRSRTRPTQLPGGGDGVARPGRPAPPSGARLRPRDDPSSWQERSRSAAPRPDGRRSDTAVGAPRNRSCSSQTSPTQRTGKPRSRPVAKFPAPTGSVHRKAWDGRRFDRHARWKRGTWRLIYIVYARRGIMRLFLFSLVLHF
jgi:hypothetical protein